ncbi:MAG: DUF177 domain-containing protein [Bdellovibrio sp.]|nr:MAG: DUF177 domain-containing protein [Bdellovibrio sp.]
MKINLLEIPEQGRSWKVSEKTEDLHGVLNDLIEDNPLSCEFSIQPLSSGTFELRGWLKTAAPELCSRCGEDFRFVLDEKFRELLLPAMDTPRNSFFSKANHVSDMTEDSPSVCEYHGQFFDMGEYLHELLAATRPSVPSPSVDPQGRCLQCKISVAGRSFGYDEPMEDKTQPFHVLKSLQKPTKD